MWLPDHGADIDALLRQLGDFHRDAQVEELLDKALAEPLATEEILRLVEQALETFKRFGLFGRDDTSAPAPVKAVLAEAD